MLVIGELINCTRRRIGEAAAARDATAIQEVARRQAEAGARVLDLNGGLPGREVETLCWLVDVVQEVTELALCLDSCEPAALAAALPRCRVPPLVNSIELARFDPVVALVQEFGAGVVALAMGPAGPPTGVEDRVANAARLVDRLAAAGVEPGRIYVDPCVMPASTGGSSGAGAAECITRITSLFPGVHTVAGLSNVSFGLPLRKLLNQTFLAVLMSRGLDAVIMDPTDRQLLATVRAAEALLGRDEYCVAYVQAFRQGLLEPVTPVAHAR
jgi:cobalamin-dependent methionine synthase I